MTVQAANSTEYTADHTDFAAATDDCFCQVQPGLAVCLSKSENMQVNSKQAAFEGDKEFIHLNCQLDGIFNAQVKDVELNCRPGDLNMGYSDGETFYVRHAEHFCNFSVMITPEMLYNLAGEELSGLNFDAQMRFFVKNAAASSRVSQTAKRISSLMSQGSKQNLLLHSAILDYLHWHLTAQQNGQVSSHISLREKKQLQAAKEFLLQDLSAAPTIAELSKAVGLNQCKLKKGFKSLYGSSIYAHFQEERMQRAMQLLKGYNVTETAMELGYSNVSHFSTAFRKQFGILPKQARKEIAPELIKVPRNH